MADGVFELAIRGMWNGKDVANVWHIKGDNLGDGISTIAQELVDHCFGFNATFFDNGFTLTSFHAREISVNPNLYEGALNTPFTGSSASSPLSNQTSLVITTRTGYAGRRKRGRHYLPGWVYSTIGQDGKFVVGVTGTLQTSLDNLILGMPYGTGAYTLGVWSALNGETRDGSGNLISVNIGTGFTPITNILVRAVPAVQRRRRIAS